MKAIILRSILALLLLPAAALGATLQSIEVQDYQVEFVIEGPFSYTIYKPEPFRALLELRDVRPGPYGGSLAFEARGLSELNISTQEGLTVVELLLQEPLELDASVQDGRLTLRLSPSQPQEVAEATPSAEAPGLADINSITFEYQDGTLRLVVGLTSPVEPSVFSLPGRIVADFPGATISAEMPQEVVAPVKAIRSAEYPEKVRLVVDLKEDVDFEVYTEDSSVVLSMPTDVRPVAVEAAPPEEEVVIADRKYTGQRISLDFQNADIVPIFMLLGEVGGLNVVVHPQVKGTITLKLKDVPWDQALDILLETFGLGKRIEGNVMKIAPLSVFAKWEQERERLKKAKERAEELVQRVIKLKYVSASDIKTEIEKLKLLSPRGTITVIEMTNTLIIRDTPTHLKDIQEELDKFINEVDKPVIQVMIEAQIVEVSSDYAQSLGIRWGGSVDIDQTNTESLEFSVNTPVTSAGASANVQGGAARLQVGTANALQLQLSLEALETVGKTRKIANPRVLTILNKAAKITQGEAIPVQTTTAEGTTTEFVDASLTLDVTPTNFFERTDEITLEVTASNNTLGTLTPQGFAIDKKEVRTQARVKDGETLVLGGIFTNTESTTFTGVPLLSRIPLLGWLFKTKTQTGPSPSELLILITPRIIRNGSAEVGK
jgi:type IV pilus secretin PilQ/predicted competence protein